MYSIEKKKQCNRKSLRKKTTKDKLKTKRFVELKSKDYKTDGLRESLLIYKLQDNATDCIHSKKMLKHKPQR